MASQAGAQKKTLNLNSLSTRALKVKQSSLAIFNGRTHNQIDSQVPQKIYLLGEEGTQ